MSFGVAFLFLIVILLIGVPVAFSIGITSLLYVCTNGFPIAIVAQRTVEGMNSFTLLALPLFILAGEIMAYGCTPRILAFVNMILNRIPGAMGAVGALGSAFFGAISGSGVATTAAIGGIVIPEMTKQGYGGGYSAALLAACGGLGIMIPPSIPMVVYCVASGESIGRLFMAGVVPGVFITASFIVVNAVIAKRKGYGVSTRRTYTSREALGICLDMLLPAMTPVIILGGVMTGIITPTEAGTTAVVYSLFLAMVIYRELKPNMLFGVLKKATISSALILFIIGVSQALAWIITATNVAQSMSQFVLSISSNRYVIMALALLVLLFLGTFMEATPIIVLTTPIFAPLMSAVGVDLIHYGVLVVVCIMVGGCTPPLAVRLFTGARIAGVKLEETFKPIYGWVAVQILALIVLAAFPQVSMFLPSRLM